MKETTILSSKTIRLMSSYAHRGVWTWYFERGGAKNRKKITLNLQLPHIIFVLIFVEKSVEYFENIFLKTFNVSHAIIMFECITHTHARTFF